MPPFGLAKTSGKFIWTAHAEGKARYYGLSKARVARVFRSPARTEAGVAPKTTAMMQPTSPKHTSEIWLMYQQDKKSGQVTIISAWRYPGQSPVGKKIPIPEEIKDELGM
ncbi:MAG: hypothetical protein WCT37_05515 [Patescibacteria group bacterium]|jgi:hypothetical protein